MKRAKLQEVQSSGTKVQIYQSCSDLDDKDWRVLGVNWTRMKDN